MNTLRRQASKREEKSDKVQAQGSLKTAPFILEPGLRGQVLPLRSHCKVQQAQGPRNESFREGSRSWELCGTCGRQGQRLQPLKPLKLEILAQAETA